MEATTEDTEDMVVYFNPVCSKARGAVEILQDKGAQFEVIEYLKELPTRGDLERIVDAIPDPPPTWSIPPSPDDAVTPFGALYIDVTNEADPNFRELEEISYTDGGIERKMQVPKGDVFHQFREEVRTGKLPAVSYIVAPSNLMRTSTTLSFVGISSPCTAACA